MDNPRRGNSTCDSIRECHSVIRKLNRRHKFAKLAPSHAIRRGEAGRYLGHAGEFETENGKLE